MTSWQSVCFLTFLGSLFLGAFLLGHIDGRKAGLLEAIDMANKLRRRPDADERPNTIADVVIELYRLLKSGPDKDPAE